MRLRRELLHDGLRQRTALRREGDDALCGVAPVGGVERGGDDVDAQDHAGSAAVGVVVDLAGAERRRVAVVEESELELAAQHACNGLLLGHPREGMRNLGEDVEAHGTN